MEARVLGLTLSADDEPLEVLSCYALQPDRAARFAAMKAADSGDLLFPGLAQGGAIAVTCKDSGGEVVETVLTDALEQCVVEDPIMFTETLLPSLVEAQFEKGGAWTLGAAAVGTLNAEKGVLFKEYEKQVSAVPPDCLRALRKMLQSGPVSTKPAENPQALFKPHPRLVLREREKEASLQAEREREKEASLQAASLGVP